MRIAIASGKGGTGKTTVAINLAVCLRGPVQLLDCDVEEPDCALFLRPRIDVSEKLGVPVPVVDTARCTACGECARFCQFHAIVGLGSVPLVFAELCHGCGGCAAVCPRGAIREEPRETGIVESGEAEGIAFVQGKLNVGEAMAAPLIRAVKRKWRASGTVIVDCPPGTSCPVLAAVRGCDYVVLVTEPTPFGLNDLQLAVEAMRALSLSFGVVINRAGTGSESVAAYCAHERISVLAELPDDRRVAEAYSRGEIAAKTVTGVRERFVVLADRIFTELRLRGPEPSRVAGR